nr:hypothetical protein [Tanacetum cinerariifolium]
MEKTRNKPKELLPYGMLLSRLFKHVESVFLELAIDNYLSFDHVMHPLAPHYERKMRFDHSKKIPHESNASSSSATQDHPSSSLSPDAMIDEMMMNHLTLIPLLLLNKSLLHLLLFLESIKTLLMKVTILDTFLSETINL